MDIHVVQNQIKSNQIQPFYIFTGVEWKVQQIYIEQIAKAKNLRIKRINSIIDIYNQLQNKSFLSQNFCYVCRDDEALLKAEQLWEQIKKGKIFSDNIYILLLSHTDKRTKFYKEFSSQICDFEPLSQNILLKYLNKEIPKLQPGKLKLLAQICEFDYGRCLLEIDKIKVRTFADYADCKEDEIPYEAFDKTFVELVEDGTIYRPPSDAIFDFVDAVLRHNVNMSFELLEQCYAVGEATMVMLSVLFNNAKNVLQVQEFSGQDISKSTGLTGREVKLAKEKTGHYDSDYMEYILRRIQQIEVGIKQGRIEEDFAMQYLLATIL